MTLREFLISEAVITPSDAVRERESEWTASQPYLPIDAAGARAALVHVAEGRTGGFEFRLYRGPFQ